MAKKTPVRQQDQFLVRLPPGMRERIKARAERAGMSMNEAIVMCLEHWFPTPKTLDQKIDELAQMVAALKSGKDIEVKVDAIILEIDDTLRNVADGRIEASESFKKQVAGIIEQWDEDMAERANEDAYNPFDDANYPGFSQGRESAGSLDDSIPFDDFPDDDDDKKP